MLSYPHTPHGHELIVVDAQFSNSLDAMGLYTYITSLASSMIMKHVRALCTPGSI